MTCPYQPTLSATSHESSLQLRLENSHRKIASVEAEIGLVEGMPPSGENGKNGLLIPNCDIVHSKEKEFNKRRNDHG